MTAAKRTFDSARQRHAKELDSAYQTLRGIVLDPKWNNLDGRDYRSAVEALTLVINRLARLNHAEQEAQSDAN